MTPIADLGLSFSFQWDIHFSASSVLDSLSWLKLQDSWALILALVQRYNKYLIFKKVWKSLTSVFVLILCWVRNASSQEMDGCANEWLSDCVLIHPLPPQHIKALTGVKVLTPGSTSRNWISSWQVFFTAFVLFSFPFWRKWVVYRF